MKYSHVFVAACMSGASFVSAAPTDASTPTLAVAVSSSNELNDHNPVENELEVPRAPPLQPEAGPSGLPPRPAIVTNELQEAPLAIDASDRNSPAPSSRSLDPQSAESTPENMSRNARRRRNRRLQKDAGEATVTRDPVIATNELPEAPTNMADPTRNSADLPLSASQDADPHSGTPKPPPSKRVRKRNAAKDRKETLEVVKHLHGEDSEENFTTESSTKDREASKVGGMRVKQVLKTPKKPNVNDPTPEELKAQEQMTRSSKKLQQKRLNALTGRKPFVARHKKISKTRPGNAFAPRIQPPLFDGSESDGFGYSPPGSPKPLDVDRPETSRLQ